MLFLHFPAGQTVRGSDTHPGGAPPFRLGIEGGPLALPVPALRVTGPAKLGI